MSAGMCSHRDTPWVHAHCMPAGHTCREGLARSSPHRTLQAPSGVIFHLLGCKALPNTRCRSPLVPFPWMLAPHQDGTFLWGTRAASRHIRITTAMAVTHSPVSVPVLAQLSPSHPSAHTVGWDTGLSAAEGSAEHQ